MEMALSTYLSHLELAESCLYGLSLGIIRPTSNLVVGD